MPRIILRADIEKELIARGCRKIKEYAFKSGSLWSTADGKFHFAMPQGGVGGWAYEDDLRAVLEMLSKR